MNRPSGDGRHVDATAGILRGEAAGVRVEHPADAFPVPDTETLPTTTSDLGAHLRSYHSTPALKPPVWKAFIPLYFYVGGVAGACATLGAAASLRDATLRGGPLRRLVRRARWLSLGATALSAGLLIADLGRPSRFLYMLRVFRPTSPMSVGTWLLTPLGGSIGVAALAGQRPGMRGGLGRAAGLAAGALGLPMTSYTGVLLANTAVPVWTRARRSLPWLFTASSASSASALLELWPLRRPESRVLSRLSLASRVGEGIAAIATAREIGEGAAGRPLRRGRSGRLWKAAEVLGWTSVALALVSGRSRSARIAGALTATASALCLRFAMTAAGDASARDPHASLPGRSPPAGTR